MRIKIFVGLLMALVMSSCNNNPYYDHVEKSGIDGFGKTYLYLDEYPIDGLEYECGYLDIDTTDAYGGFLYELGTSCRFYLNDQEVLSISGNDLQDGQVYEITDGELRQKLYDADLNLAPNRIVIGN